MEITLCYYHSIKGYTHFIVFFLFASYPKIIKKHQLLQRKLVFNYPSHSIKRDSAKKKLKEGLHINLQAGGPDKLFPTFFSAMST